LVANHAVAMHASLPYSLQVTKPANMLLQSMVNRRDRAQLKQSDRLALKKAGGLSPAFAYPGQEGSGRVSVECIPDAPVLEVTQARHARRGTVLGAVQNLEGGVEELGHRKLVANGFNEPGASRSAVVQDYDHVPIHRRVGCHHFSYFDAQKPGSCCP